MTSRPAKRESEQNGGKKTHSFCRELLWTADNKSGVIDTLSCVHPSNALNARQEVVVAATDDVQSRVKGMRYNSENERERERWRCVIRLGSGADRRVIRATVILPSTVYKRTFLS